MEVPPCPIIPTTPLASGPINQFGDTIEVVLVECADNPSVIMIRYQSGVTVRPGQAGQTAGALRCWTLLATT